MDAALEHGAHARSLRVLLHDSPQAWIVPAGTFCAVLSGLFRRGQSGGVLLHNIARFLRRTMDHHLRLEEFEFVHRTADVASWVWDIRADRVQWFGDADRLLGLRPGSHTGRFGQYLSLLHPEDAPAARQTLIECLRGTRSSYRTEERLLRPDGDVRWLEAIGQAEYSAEGRALRMVGVVRDITERRGIEERIRSLESFSLMVAHDLIAPARTIGSFAQVLREDHAAGMSAECLGVVARIERNAVRLADMVRGLLDLSRLGRAPLEFAPVDLAALAEEVIEDLRRACEYRGEIHLAPLPRCRGDARLLRQVLQNLIANAMKFSRLAARPRIELGADRLADGGVEYCVRDNGCGFDMRYAARLFDVFQRMHSQSQYEGNGIGLATVRRIVERHGGTVRADSAVGRGAAFYFMLPTG
jgi:PAS domain S-box-containing protein